MKHRFHRAHRARRPETHAEMLRRRWPPQPDPVVNPITGLVYCTTMAEWGVICQGHEPLQRRPNA